MAGLGNASGGGTSGAVRAGRAFVELLADDSKLVRALEGVRARLKSFGSFMIRVGAATAGVGAGITAAFKPALDVLGENAKIANAAEAFGLTAEAASRLFGIMASGGSDIRDATEGLVTFNQRVADAIAGTSDEAKQLFEGLNVSAQEFANLDSAQRFYKLIAALKAVADPAKRVQLLLKAVGEDTGKNLVPILSMTEEEVRRLGDAFETSAEDLKAARDATFAQKIAAAQLSAAWSQVATAIAPNIKEFAEIVSKVVKPVAAWVKENRHLVATVLAIGAGLAAAGTAFGAIGTAAFGIAAAFGVAKVAIVAAWAAITSPIGIATLAVVGFGVAFVRNFDAIKAAFFSFADRFGALGRLWKAEWNLQENAVRGFADVFRESVGIVGQSWGGIVAAISKGDLQTAGEIALTTLELLWAKTFAQLTRTWNDFKGLVVDGWHHLTDGFPVEQIRRDLADLGTELIRLQDLVGNFLQKRLDELKSTFADLVAFLGPALAPLTAAFEYIAKRVEFVWGQLTGNLIEDIVTLGSSAEKVFEELANAVNKAWMKIIDRILEGTIEIAVGLDSITPGEKYKKAAEDLRAVQKHFNEDARRAADEELARRIAGIEETRKAIVERLQAERMEARRAREEARADDERAALARARELQDRLDELNAKARMPGAAAGAGAGRGLGMLTSLFSKPEALSGQVRGTFDAAQARQFGSDTFTQQQLKAAKETAANTDEMKDLLAGIKELLIIK